jgi:hypothetical protein
MDTKRRVVEEKSEEGMAEIGNKDIRATAFPVEV